MRWYSARLLFESEVQDGRPNDPICEDSVRLIWAEDEESAEERAREIGRRDETVFENHEGAEVVWTFVRVLEIQDLCEPQKELEHGAEVYSRLFRKSSGVMD